MCVGASAAGWSDQRCRRWRGVSSGPEEEQLLSLFPQELPPGLSFGGETLASYQPPVALPPASLLTCSSTSTLTHLRHLLISINSFPQRDSSPAVGVLCFRFLAPALIWLCEIQVTVYFDCRRMWQSPVGTNMAAGPTPGPHGGSLPTQCCSGSSCWIKTTAMYQPVKRWVIIIVDWNKEYEIIIFMFFSVQLY